ncbi:MAG: NUDIX domain-containing protein, partial [Bacteroidota bacterium]|nr:NUDIX domain-containing protein [Candidatus Kapabacteria bacterium]MDW8219241.1 NUDIX domain-containing protein [Bacteroidota bacterium]
SIEPHELPAEAALRELEEETGLRLDTLWVLPFVGMYYDVVHNTINAVPCFAGIVEHSTTITLSREHSAYAWLTLLEAQNCLRIPSHRQACLSFYDALLHPLERGESSLCALYRRA